MRKNLASAFLFLLCAVSASAGTITSLSPNTFRVNSGEQFITVYGSGLGNRLVFDGPAGHFEVDASAQFTGSVVGWVPEAIIARTGTYTLNVTGPLGNSGPATFTVTGFKTPLFLLMPEYLSIQPRSRDGNYVKYEVFAMGGSDPSPKVSCDPPTGSFFKMGITTVNCVATNIYGERASGSFPVYVRDEEAPILEAPREPIVVKATSLEGAIVDFKVTAWDEIWGDVVTECDPKPNSLFPVGITQVQCTATDYDLNVGHASFSIEVIGERKYYPLTVRVPNTVIEKAVDPRGAQAYFKISVDGTDDPSPRVECTMESGSVFPVGETVVICSAIDAWGMRGQNDFKVIVLDTNDPEIWELYTKPDRLVADGRLYPIDVYITVKDDIDLQPFCEIQSVSSNEKIDLGDFDDPKSYDWKITGPMSLELRAERRGLQRDYNVWVTCSDYFGNIALARTTVSVVSGTANNSAEPEPPKKRRSVR
jgi:hypothetical protein